MSVHELFACSQHLPFCPHELMMQVWASICAAQIACCYQHHHDPRVPPIVGDMLTEMQSGLKQFCGNSSVGNPEAVARLIAEKIGAMNLSPAQNRVQGSCDDLLALPAPVKMAAPEPAMLLQQVCALQTGGRKPRRIKFRRTAGRRATMLAGLRCERGLGMLCKRVT